MSSLIRIPYLIVILGLFVFSSFAHAWTIEEDFEDDTAGQKPSTSRVEWFSGTKTDSTNRYGDSGQGAALSASRGSSGWDEFGAIAQFPSTLRQGDEVWYQIKTNMPQSFDYTSSTFALKFMRVHTLNNSGDNEGYNDIYIRPNGSYMYQTEIIPDMANETLDSQHKVQKGVWETVEMYVKLDSNAGVVRIWKDGVLIYENTSWPTLVKSASKSDMALLFTYWNGDVPKNQTMYIDDLVITNERPSTVDSNGYPYIGTGSGPVPDPVSDPVSDPDPDPDPGSGNAEGEILINEDFNSAGLSGGWYDNTSPVINFSEGVGDTKGAIEYNFPQGATVPTGGETSRHEFSETDQVYLRYYVKYSDNWQGSNHSYHPHEFYLMTNADDKWKGPGFSYLTVYVEQNEGDLRVNIQDSENIDSGSIGQDLLTTSSGQSGGVAGCNGSLDNVVGDCYEWDGVWRNEKIYSSGVAFSDNQSSKYYKGKWHLVEALVKLNSVQSGQTLNNGMIKLWLDDELIMERNNVLFRTAENGNMAFNQLIIGPYIGDGSPVNQTFWVDDVMVTRGPDSGAILSPMPPNPLMAE